MTERQGLTARRVLLDGLTRDADIFQLVSVLAPLHPRDNIFPGEVFRRIAADALDWCRASRADGCPWRDSRERFLPERTFRGRQNTKLQYAVLAAAALHGGTEPDLPDEVAWWQTDDFWQYALFAACAYIRAAASRAGLPERQACEALAERPRHPAPIKTSSGRRRSGHLTVSRPIITAARRAFFHQESITVGDDDALGASGQRSCPAADTTLNPVDRPGRCRPRRPRQAGCHRLALPSGRGV
jgi:hypothetical protein